MSETILASIAVEKVPVSAGSYTFRSEIMEVEVVRYLRHRCGSRGEARKRFYYSAVIKAPEKLAPGYAAFGLDKGQMTVNVVRKLNPKWKRPQFGEAMSVEVSA